MLRSRVGFAAVGCVLAAGLLMSGGAVAAAVPGLGGSSSNGDDGTNDSVHGAPTAGGPVGNVTDIVRQTIRGVTGSPGSAAQPGQQPSTGPTSTLGSGRRPGQQPSTATTIPKTQAGGTDTEDQEHAGLVPAHPNPVAAIPSVVAPVFDAVAPEMRSRRSLMLSRRLPMLSRRLLMRWRRFDVIAPGQYIPTSVVGAVVPLTQLPSDLSSFLSGIAGVVPEEDGSGLIHGAGLAAAAGGSGVSQAPVVLPFAGVGNATRVATTLDVILLGRASALSGMAAQAPSSAFPMVTESFFPNRFDELLLISSLWALAAVALPGIGGFVILTVVGVRIQYGRLTRDSHREHQAFRDSPIPRAVKRWMSAR